MYRCAFTPFQRLRPMFRKMTGPKNRLRPIASQIMTLGPPHVLCSKTLLAHIPLVASSPRPSAWLMQYRLSSVKRTFCHCHQFQFRRCCVHCSRCCRCHAVNIGRRQHGSRSDSCRRMVWPLTGALWLPMVFRTVSAAGSKGSRRCWR